jgi:hypothetical protein
LSPEEDAKGWQVRIGIQERTFPNNKLPDAKGPHRGYVVHQFDIVQRNIGKTPTVESAFRIAVDGPTPAEFRAKDRCVTIARTQQVDRR